MAGQGYTEPGKPSQPSHSRTLSTDAAPESGTIVVVSLLAGGTGRLVLFVILWVYQQRAKNPVADSARPC